MASFCTACGQPLASGVKFCSQCGAKTNSVESTSNVPIVGQSNPRCRTCGVGLLQLEKKYRMSTPVVVIGYIILAPSVLFVIACLVTMIRISGSSYADGASMASGIVFLFALAGFVSGLVGWLLIMKKKVLCCKHCSAVVPAS